MKRFVAEPEQEQDDIDFLDEQPPIDDFIESQEEQQDDIGDLFPDEYLEPLRGLLFLGKLENEVFYGGHSFLIKTLTEGELLRVGQLCKAYMGSLAEGESRRLYVVSAAIESVDGMPIVEPYKYGDDAIYEKSKVVRRWYPAVISFLFDEYLKIEQTAMEVSNALKK